MLKHFINSWKHFLLDFCNTEIFLIHSILLQYLHVKIKNTCQGKLGGACT